MKFCHINWPSTAQQSQRQVENRKYNWTITGATDTVTLAGIDGRLDMLTDRKEQEMNWCAVVLSCSWYLLLRSQLRSALSLRYTSVCLTHSQQQRGLVGDRAQ